MIPLLDSWLEIVEKKATAELMAELMVVMWWWLQQRLVQQLTGGWLEGCGEDWLDGSEKDGWLEGLARTRRARQLCWRLTWGLWRGLPSSTPTTYHSKAAQQLHPCTPYNHSKVQGCLLMLVLVHLGVGYSCGCFFVTCNSDTIQSTTLSQSSSWQEWSSAHPFLFPSCIVQFTSIPRVYTAEPRYVNASMASNTV